MTIGRCASCGHNFWYGFIRPGGDWGDISYILKSGRFALSTDPTSVGDNPADYDCEGIENPGQWESKKELVDFCKSMRFQMEFA